MQGGKSAGTFGKARLAIWIHKIDGLNEADYIFAAKVHTLALIISSVAPKVLAAGEAHAVKGAVAPKTPDLTKAQIAELQKALPNCTIRSNPTKWRLADPVRSD